METKMISPSYAYWNVCVQSFLTLMLANSHSRKEQKINSLFALFILLFLKLMFKSTKLFLSQAFGIWKLLFSSVMPEPHNQGDRFFPSGNTTADDNSL